MAQLPAGRSVDTMPARDGALLTTRQPRKALILPNLPRTESRECPVSWRAPT